MGRSDRHLISMKVSLVLSRFLHGIVRRYLRNVKILGVEWNYCSVVDLDGAVRVV